MKKAILITSLGILLALTGSAKHPNAKAVRSPVAQAVPIPANIFIKPTPDDISQNQQYWQGYMDAQTADVFASVPLPACPQSYEDYRSAVVAVEKPRTTKFLFLSWVNSYNVGWDTIIDTVSNYLWQNLPTSPNKVVCQ